MKGCGFPLLGETHLGHFGVSVHGWGGGLCGCGLVQFQEDIFSISNKTASNQATTGWIWDMFRRVLNLPPNTIMGYKTHTKSIKMPGRMGPPKAPFSKPLEAVVECAITLSLSGWHNHWNWHHRSLLFSWCATWKILLSWTRGIEEHFMFWEQADMQQLQQQLRSLNKGAKLKNKMERGKSNWD